MTVSHAIRIAITGVESTGKTTLTEALARTLGGIAIMECARSDSDVIAGTVSMATLNRLVQCQFSACQDAVQKADLIGASCIVSDTDATVLRLWGQHVFGRAPMGLEPLANWPDLTLLCAPTIPWEPDPLRTLPNENDRRALHALYCDVLHEHPNTAVIDGTTHEKRLDQAVRAFQKFVG